MTLPEYMTVKKLADKFCINKVSLRRLIRKEGFKLKWERYDSQDKRLGRWLVRTEDYTNYIKQFNP